MFYEEMDLDGPKMIEACNHVLINYPKQNVTVSKNLTCKGTLRPHIALAYRLDAISQGPKNSQFPRPNPLPLAHVMYMPASKALRTGAV